MVSEAEPGPHLKEGRGSAAHCAGTGDGQVWPDFPISEKGGHRESYVNLLMATSQQLTLPGVEQRGENVLHPRGVPWMLPALDFRPEACTPQTSPLQGLLEAGKSQEASSLLLCTGPCGHRSVSCSSMTNSLTEHLLLL